MERNRKAGQNPPRVVAQTEEEEEEEEEREKEEEKEKEEEEVRYSRRKTLKEACHSI